MKVLVIEPGRVPEVREIENSLKAMQKLVCGTIEALYPFEDTVALVCNEEGKCFGMQPNRGLLDEAGNLYDIICGTFFSAAHYLTAMSLKV